LSYFTSYLTISTTDGTHDYSYYFLYYLSHILSMKSHTTPYRTVLSILFISHTSIHITTIPSPAIHAHTFQLSIPPTNTHLSNMGYPAGYDGDDPPPHLYILLMKVMMKMTVTMPMKLYNGDGVDKKIGVYTKITARRDAPINIMRNMASKFFNWECILPFKIHPQEQNKRPL
jgi:hypothetical protein